MKFTKILLIGLTISGTVTHGFVPNRVNNFLYGPYMHDPAISTIPVNLISLFQKKPCQPHVITRLNQDFTRPGGPTKNPTIQDQMTIAVCAKRQQDMAFNLLEKWVYPHQNTALVTSANRELKGVLYDPDFILSVSVRYPQIFQAIPDSHPNYLALIQKALPVRPHTFNHLTLRYKRHPWVTQTLFDIAPSYDDIYKHLAMQYTIDEQQRQSFVMHNGLLYLELPIEKRKKPYLSYHAYIQNDLVYPFIPREVIDLFNHKGAIMVPRAITHITWFKQAIFRRISTTITPIKDLVFGDNLNDDITIETTTSNVIQHQHKINFQVERTVVTDIRTINKIEVKKNRRLLNLWRIARFDDNGQVFVAMFRPIGRDYLGAIIIEKNGRYMFSDYSAVFSMDGESIWRLNDNGTFSAEAFHVEHIFRDASNGWHFQFRWTGESAINQFELIEDGGYLLKKMVNQSLN